MISRTVPRRARSLSFQKRGDPPPPPAIFEYGYYVILLYSIWSEALGISIPFLGVVMVAGLTALCMKHFKFRLSVYEPIKFPVACAISFIAVQTLVHGEPILSSYYVRDFVPWILFLVIAQSLVRRPGFFHRFAVVIFLIALTSLPFLDFRGAAMEVQRAGATGGPSGFGNSNSLGAWFGFFAVYFTVLALEAKADAIRVLSWVIVAGCLLVVGLTVSRGPLLGFVLAALIIFRRLPRRGLLPIAILIFVSGVVFAFGMYRQSLESFSERGTEESGRLLVWPIVIERIIDHPIAGVGISTIGSFVPGADGPITPHNSFLFIGLGSGIVPMMFFIAYWYKAARGALYLTRTSISSNRFYLPLFIFTLVEANLLQVNFMNPWTTVTLAALLAGYQRELSMRNRGAAMSRMRHRVWGPQTVADFRASAIRSPEARRGKVT
jgi:O-antigen ligase